MLKRGLLVMALVLAAGGTAWAAPPSIQISLGDGSRHDWVLGLRLLLFMTVLTLAPAVLILTTSFTRIVIVFTFLRNGLGLNQTPSNQLLIAYALFLTFLVMMPVWAEVAQRAVTPYERGKIAWSEAVDLGTGPIRDFMLAHTRKDDLLLFYELSKQPRPASPSQVAPEVLLPAFVTSELRTAFQMGFALLVPFLVLDVVVASILTSMGMLMLPPAMVALPFKVLIFVLVDGWALLARALVTSFHHGAPA